MTQRSTLKLVYVVIDARHGKTKQNTPMLSSLRQP